MAYTTIQIQKQKDKIIALETAVNASIATGGVHTFKQGSTEFNKMTTTQIETMLSNAENLLFRMEDI